jgi:hypothetical protein
MLFCEVRNLLDRRHATFGTFGEIGSVPSPRGTRRILPRFLAGRAAALDNRNPARLLGTLTMAGCAARGPAS